MLTVRNVMVRCLLLYYMDAIQLTTKLLNFITILFPVSIKASMINCKKNKEQPETEAEEAEEENEKEALSDKDMIKSNADKERLCSLEESKVDRIWRTIWPHLNCYLLPVDDYTRWFLMDEVHTCLFLLPFFSSSFLLSSVLPSLLLQSSLI